jgi:hypothetical protein
MSAPTIGREAGWRGDTSVGRARLWLGLLLAPSAWFVGELLGYYITARSCDTRLGGVPLPRAAHPAGTVLVVEIVAAIVAALGLFIAVGSLRRTRLGGDAEGPAPLGRVHFMAFTGAIASALFLIGIVWLGFPAIVVNACNQTR